MLDGQKTFFQDVKKNFTGIFSLHFAISQNLKEEFPQLDMSTLSPTDVIHLVVQYSTSFEA